MKKSTRLEFISKAYKVHNNKYDYSKVVYRDNKNKIRILCKRCLCYFFQTPGNHLIGHNCNCYKTRTTVIFTTKAMKVHGNKYGYSLVNYIKANIEVDIICNSCLKVFKQLPLTHLRGHDKCCYQKHPDILKSLDQFILDAKKVHQDNYSYHRVVYKGAKIEVQILCKKCNQYFWQMPNSHLTGNRCTFCYLYGHKGGVTKLNLPLYKTYAPQLEKYQVVHKIIQNTLDLLGVECKNCEEIFVPSIKATISRIKAIKGERLGESHLYCSDKCKSSCKLYGFHPTKQIDPESIMYINSSDKEQARNCQTNHLKQLQLDEYTYSYCEKCGTEAAIELHHTLEIAKYGLEAVSLASHILLCNECHKDLTKQCRNK